MKLIIKKIIAREVLALTLVLVIALISFLCTYPYNAYMRNQLEDQSKVISEKTKLADSLSLSYRSKLAKQNWFFEKFSSHYNLTGDTNYTRDKIWKRLDKIAIKDTIKYYWENVWDMHFIKFNKEIGLPNPAAFQAFIDNNKISKIDSANNNSSMALKSEIISLSNSKWECETKILSFKEQIELGWKVLFICAIILFGVRYLFNSIRWSIKTLKQKTE